MIHFTDKEVALQELLRQLLTEIDAIYTRSASAQYIGKLHATYHSHLYKLQEWAEYQTGNEKFKAMVSGIGSFGRLVLKMENGERKMFDFKEVELVRN